jgi:hypothetical protein
MPLIFRPHPWNAENVHVEAKRHCSKQEAERALRHDESKSLIERIARADSRALIALYDSEAPLMIALADCVLGSRTAAESVVHDVFLEVWRRPSALFKSDVRRHLVCLTARAALLRLEANAAALE